MDARETELVQEVVVQVRAALQAAAPAWRRVRVRFESADGCFSTRVSHGGDGHGGDSGGGEVDGDGHAWHPLDAVRHRALFVALQAPGRQLVAGRGPAGRACEVDIDRRSHRATLAPARPAPRRNPADASA